MMRAILICALLAGCAIAPPRPEADPIAAPTRQEGELPIPDTMMAASCVSQRMPGSITVLRQSDVIVQPVVPGGYALVLGRPANGRAAFRLLASGPDTARDLERALMDCAAEGGAA